MILEELREYLGFQFHSSFTLEYTGPVALQAELRSFSGFANPHRFPFLVECKPEKTVGT